MLRVKKVYFHLFGKIHNVINVRNYMKHYTKYLRQLGIKIQGTPGYISSDAYFDSHFYGAISIGSEVTISREVMVLCHDYSIVQGLKSIGKYDYKIETGIPHAMGGVTIGNNCFIGARVSLLPGTIIGDNCIIGACSVVKGNIPDNSIVVGNPGKVVADTREWALKKLNNGKFSLSKNYNNN